jgi:ribosomal protein S18 acetylase RimI-like enzyme
VRSSGNRLAPSAAERGVATLAPIVGARIRQARDRDGPSIADIHVRSWRAAYRGLLPDALLDRLSTREREGSWAAILGEREGGWLTLVAEGESGGLVGFCSVATPGRDPSVDESTAEVGALYVDPDHWRRGVGGALLTAALEELARRRFRDAVLWVLPENHGALAFYARFGFEIEEGVEKREERSGRPVIRLRTEISPGSP